VSQAEIIPRPSAGSKSRETHRLTFGAPSDQGRARWSGGTQSSWL